MDFVENDDHFDDLESVAVIGVNGRFPNAESIDEFWQNLCAGVEATTFFTPEELIESGISPALVNLPNYVRAKPRLKDVDKFDAAFFNIPPSEAQLMDPQHRFFLECAWHVLEDAGYDPYTYEGLIALFAGASSNTYLLNHVWTNRQLVASVGGLTVGTTNAADYLPTRVSYKLNLKGPSFNVQSACSTSLVAIHLACQHLLNYQCDIGLAGGSCVSPSDTGYLYTKGNINSPDGHCRPFDAQAEGTVFANAVGVVALKRLSDALRDGDQIYAVVRGVSVNNDGSMKVGFTAPGMEGQTQVILAAQMAANVHPESIGYVEAHGTGTLMGDPIEVGALTQAFRLQTDKKQFCAIGSIKGNIGHTDTAAGVSSFIKTALILKHKQIPPSINFKTPNPKIDFPNTPFFVNDTFREWESDGRPRRAAVSSFGIGGTNVHAILEEAPEREPSGPSRRWQMLTLSARTETALETMTDNLALFMQANPDVPLADAAFTLHLGRSAFEFRRIVVCQSAAEASDALLARDNRVTTGTASLVNPSVAFMFSGQGSQYINMGRDLYENETLFRDTIDQCADLLTPHLGLDLRQVLFPAQADETAVNQINQTWLTQPALFVVEYALAQLWLSWGIQPQAMIGHSIGEYVAACLADVLTLEDALSLVALRGRLMQKMPAGAMLSVGLAEAEVRPLLPTAVTVATINSPESCVVAGPIPAIDAFEKQMTEQGVDCRRLRTSHAFHSAMMEPMLAEFTQAVSRISLGEPQIPYISNVTGTWITPEQTTDPRYWAQHLRQAVRFADGVALLAKNPNQILLEVGPGTTLRTLAQRHPNRRSEQLVLASMRHPNEKQSDDMVLIRALGQVWLAGIRPDWSAYYQGEQRHRRSLPLYPFERQRYWLEPGQDSTAQNNLMFKNPKMAQWFYLPSWQRSQPPVWEKPAATAVWLVFTGSDSFSQAVLNQLREKEQTVLQVVAGEAFAVNGDHFTVRPGQSEDYQALWQTLGQGQQLPSHVLHLWNVAPVDESAADFTAKTLERSFYSLLFLAQAIANAGKPNEKIQLAVIASETQQVMGEETAVQPEKATLLGPCKVIPQEMTQIACRSIDIPRLKAGSPREALLAEQVIAELQTALAPTETTIAYRGYDRLYQTYELAELPEVNANLDAKLRPNGVYLITGGLGGIGLTLAKFLAETYQAKLILTSRSFFPPHETWEQWLATHDEADRTSGRIRAVQELESLGAEVMLARADVSDLAEMQEAVAQAVARFGTIHGVVHSAGLPGGGIIQLKTADAAQMVLTPKVVGTRVLEKALRDVRLDFLMLCSSTASVIGGLGQVDYCAANTFLDAYAQATNGRHDTLVVSVNWDAWAEVGMAVNTASTYTSGQPQKPATTAVQHPLLHSKYTDKSGHLIYEASFDPEKHWVLSDHRILGIPTAPGTTHLELVRAGFSDQTQKSSLNITEAIFMTPLMVNLGDRKEAELSLEPKNGGYDFRVRSKAGVAANGETKWDMHLMGHVEAMADAVPPQHNIAELLARCSERTIHMEKGKVQGAKIEGSEEGVFVGEHWQMVNRIDIGVDEAIATLEMDANLQTDLPLFPMHPAMLDIATSFSMGFLSNTLYLPLSYKALRFYAPFPAQAYAHVRRLSGTSKDQETLALHVTLLDSNGRTVAEVEQFTLKRVRTDSVARLRGKPEAETDEAALESSEAATPRNLSMAILPQEGVDAFQRILARNHLPQIAVCTRHLPTVQLQMSRLQETLLKETPQAGQGNKHARPNMQTLYMAPRNEAEEQLAEIWQRVLGLEQVGIHDNFFELGGESMLGIRLVAQIREAGYPASPEQLFQNQTIAELVAVLRPDLAEGGRSDLILTAQQRYLLSQTPHEPHILRARLAESLDTALLEQAVGRVWGHHQALQMRFSQEGDAWKQEAGAAPGSNMLTVVDLSTLTADEEEEGVKAEINRLQYNFNQPNQPLLRLTYLRLGAGLSDCLLVAVSPLVADAAALGILVEDLALAYEQLASGEAKPLTAVTTAFPNWLRQLEAFSTTPECEAERPFWQEIAATPTNGWLAADTAEPAITGHVVALHGELSADETERLQSVPEQYLVQIEELLLTAFLHAVAGWSDQTAFLWQMTSYGRTAVLPQADAGRLVGCLQTHYPLALTGPTSDEMGDWLTAVKAQIRRVPQNGLGYALLCANDPTLTVATPFSFAYQPPILNQSLMSLSYVRLAQTNKDHQLHFTAGIVGQSLHYHLYYDNGLYQKATMVDLLERISGFMSQYIEYCLTAEEVQFTAQDFPQAGLDTESLNKFISQITKK